MGYFIHWLSINGLKLCLMYYVYVSNVKHMDFKKKKKKSFLFSHIFFVGMWDFRYLTLEYIHLQIITKYYMLTSVLCLHKNVDNDDHLLLNLYLFILFFFKFCFLKY